MLHERSAKGSWPPRGPRWRAPGRDQPDDGRGEHLDVRPPVAHRSRLVGPGRASTVVEVIVRAYVVARAGPDASSWWTSQGRDDRHGPGPRRRYPRGCRMKPMTATDTTMTTTDTFVFDFIEGDRSPAGPAGREGRQSRRDDAHGAAGAAGVHDHHAGLPLLPAQRPGPRASATRSRSMSRGWRRRWAVRWARRRTPARVRAIGRPLLDAGHDGDGPQHRTQRPERRRACSARPRRALRGTLSAPHPDVRQDRPRPGRATTSSTRSSRRRSTSRSPPTSNCRWSR